SPIHWGPSAPAPPGRPSPVLTGPSSGERTTAVLAWPAGGGRWRGGTPGGGALRRPRRRGLGFVGRRKGTPHSAARAIPSAVSVAVGVRLLTRMPYSASSIATERVELSRPLLPVH